MAPKIRIGVNLNFAKYVYGHKRALDVVKSEIGVRWVEAVPDMDFGTAFYLTKPDKFRAFHRDVAEHADKIGVKIASVLTFYRDNGYICHHDPDVRESAYATMRAMAEQAAAYGADLIGPVFNCILHEDYEDAARREECMKLSFETWKRWLVEIKSLGVPGATIEQLSTSREPPCTIPGAHRILDELAGFREAREETAARAWLCYDLGHGVTDDEKESPGDDDFEAWFREFGDDIAEIHVKNTDPQFMSTWPFTAEYAEQGIIDLDKVTVAVRDHIRVPEIYMFVEFPGKRGRRIGELDALEKNAASVQALKRALSTAGFREDGADGTWSVQDDAG